MQTSNLAEFKKRFQTTAKAYKVTMVQNNEIDLEHEDMQKSQSLGWQTYCISSRRSPNMPHLQLHPRA